MWVLLSLGTALFAGTADALAKKALQTERVIAVSWIRAGWGALFLFPFWLKGAPPSDPRVFWSSILCAVPFEIAASFALQTALRLSPISACIPFLAFTPVFLTVVGWFFLGEKVSALGLAGIAAVTAGAFVLHRRGHVGLGKTESKRGPLLVLLVAFLYAITTALCRRALSAAPPFTFCATYFGATALGLLPFQWRWLPELVRRPRLFAAMGFVEASAFLLQSNAFLFAPIAYAIALKRLSLLVSVGYGRLLFGERDISARAAGAGLMVAGAAMLAFA